MHAHADKTQENRSSSAANEVSHRSNRDRSTFHFVDNRPEAIAQRKLQEIAKNSPRAKQAAQLQATADNYITQQRYSIQEKENKTGLHDNLKSSVEKKTRFSTNDVVAYCSDQKKPFDNMSNDQKWDIHKRRFVNCAAVRHPLIQQKSIYASALNGATENGTANIFDSRISSGKLFEKDVNVPNHNVPSVIKKYHTEITPMGNAAAGETYTDYNFTDPAPAMPIMPPPNIILYLMNNIVGGSTVGARLHVPNNRAMERLLGSITWQDVKNKLTLWTTQRDCLKDNKYIDLIDPFIVRLTFQSQTQGQNDWVIDTQFADSGTGYIIRVENGERDITGKIVTAGDFANDAANPANDGSEYIYSSTHVGGVATFDSRTSNLRGHNVGDTLGDQHRGFDALTWMGAEGARFIPVGELGGDATPTANFYTKPQKSGWRGAHNVSLNWLMANWGANFNRAYGITKETMAGIVNANGATINKKPAKPNYNLSTGIMDR